MWKYPVSAGGFDILESWAFMVLVYLDYLRSVWNIYVYINFRFQKTIKKCPERIPGLTSLVEALGKNDLILWFYQN